MSGSRWNLRQSSVNGVDAPMPSIALRSTHPLLFWRLIVTTSIRRLFFAAALSTLGALVATAAVAAPSIDVTAFGNGASFTTDFAYGKAWVHVSGPQGYQQKVALSSLDDLAFVLDDGAVDGRYHWELLAVQPISPDLRAKLAAAAQAGDRGIVDRLKAAGDLQSATFFGSFQVRSGAIELPTKNYSADDRDIPLKDQIIGDDLIVFGNACIGLDCANGESFGFDTLRLKESNLRIKFEDTSNTATFPGNDWTLVANETSNGGLNHFSIDDATANTTPFRIEAGAPTAALYVQKGTAPNTGNIGLGTTTPAVNLHVVHGDTPTLRLDQDGSQGFQSQTWDIAGNETNFFVRDVTSGSTLPIRVFPGGNNNAIVVRETGDVGFGTDSARADLHVLGGGAVHQPTNNAVVALFQNNGVATDGAIVSILAGNGSANAQMWFGDADNDKAGRIIYRNGSDAMSFWTSGGEQLFIENDGQFCFGCNNTQGDAIRHSNGARLTTGGAWTNASSRTLKQNINELTGADALAAFNQLSPVTYNYKTEQDETYLGFIAEDVPELVAMKDGKSLAAMDVVALLTKVVQEQQKLALQQQQAIDALTERLEGLGVE